MANRRPQPNGRRMDFDRNDRNKNFGRGGVSPWQGGSPGGGLPNLLPLGGGSTEATLALASNIINLLQPRQNPVPSLLDMPMRRDFGPAMGRYDRGYGPNRMGNQGNFRRTGNYNRAGERINTYRKPFRPNDGQRQQNKSSPKKEADFKAKPVEQSEEDKKEAETTSVKTDSKDDDKKKDAPKTRYDDINPQLLKCHICNKSMWDGRSFENHLSGRAHAIMMQKTAESYALTADTMRQEFKIREMKRTRKTGQQPPRDFYCAMCDMYAADGAAHRTNVGHRKLKKYLHPACSACRLEMPTRIELDEHRLTPEHLKGLRDRQGASAKPKPEVMVISTLSMEQSYLREDRHRWRHNGFEDKDGKAIKEEAKDDAEVKKEATEDGEQPAEESQDNLDKEDTILDYQEGDDLSNVTKDMYPAYSTERGIGKSFLSEFRCVQCRLCHKLLDNEETAEVHLRTWRHHQLFLRLLAEGSVPQPKPQESAKRMADHDDSGNWKRRKTSESDLNGHDNSDVKHEMDEDEQETESALPPADELEDWEQPEGDEGNNKSVTEEDNQEEQPEESVAEQEAGSQPEAEDAEPEPQPEPEPMKTASPRGRGSPRARGRGRGRGRGRY